MNRLFGTDGVRGIANSELKPDLAYRMGWAVAKLLADENSHRPKFIVGRDTRISGAMLEAALVSGLSSAGADVYLAGIIPTPGIAYLTREHDADAGVMISASHNSFEYNGIKLFSQDGYKLSDEIEDQIERLVTNYDQLRDDWPVGADIGHLYEMEDAAAEYARHLLDCMPVDLTGLKIALDCAHGASCYIAPAIFQELGADLITIGIEPDGYNINSGCGSTDLSLLQKTVTEEGCFIGLAFDGDADRLLAVDGQGRIADGDVIMSIIADDLKRESQLKDNTLVATVMSNLGLSIMGENNAIRIVRTQVGDRYVLEEMLRCGYTLGGEQSGHLILLDYSTTGDGILSALRLLKALKNKQQNLCEARGIMRVLPQVLENVEIENNDKAKAMSDTDVQSEIDRITKELGSRGRIFVRASGTEAKIRVMVEGETIEDIEMKAKTITTILKNKYGVKK